MTTAKKIFVAGISGCVGHYLFDVLCENPNYELYLLVRDPQKIKFKAQLFSNVKIIQADLKDISAHENLIKQMDQVIHIAANWGGHEENLDHSVELFNLLDPTQCQKVIYLSTASILGQ